MISTMKKHLFLFCLCCLALLSIQCSDDDTPATTPEETTPQTDSYFALQSGNNWQYNVTTDGMASSQDQLAVAPDPSTPVGFSNLDANEPANGFMTTLLATGYLKDELSILRYTGALEFAIDPSNPIQIDIEDALVYNAEAASGTTLSTVTQSFSQDLDGIPITIDIVASTQQLALLDTYTSGGFTFEKAVQSSLIINATISAEILGVQIPLLPSQDVLIAENTYAINNGLVNSEVTFTYEFVDLSGFGIDLPFPASDTSVSTQVINDFELTLN